MNTTALTLFMFMMLVLVVATKVIIHLFIREIVEKQKMLKYKKQHEKQARRIQNDLEG